MDLLELLAPLLSLAIIVLIAWSVIVLARRWLWATLAGLTALLAAGVGLLWIAGEMGYAFDFQRNVVEFSSEEGQLCFVLGRALVALFAPAFLLVPFAQAENVARRPDDSEDPQTEKADAVRGPVGGQWPVLIGGYFVACAVWSMVLFSWLTGYAK